MRYDNQHKQRTHQKLIEEASAAIRQHGPDNISVAGIMTKVELTHGGFYAHFKSKDDLIAQAITYMLEERTEAFKKRLEGADISTALAYYIDTYLSTMHRDMRDKGCVVVALNGDIARMSDAVKIRFEQGIESTINILSNILMTLNKPDPKTLAASVLAEMVGAVAISRTLSDSKLSEWLLNNTRINVKGRIGLNV